MNESRSRDGAATSGVSKATVSPVLKEVSRLAAGVASVATGSTGSTGSATGNPRNKCALQPGHSLMDWIRLGQSGKDLTGVGPMAGTLSITANQLAEHNTDRDVWLAIRGKVYNVTAYLPFHPGGVQELMKGAGKDATSLFNQIHPWVNYETILQKCYIGKLESLDATIDREALFDGKDTNSNTPRKPSAQFTAPQTYEFMPRFDWIQKTDNITIIFYTKHYCNPQVQITNPSKEHQLTVYLTLDNMIYENALTFVGGLQWPCKVDINYETGKVEIMFKKVNHNLWDIYGKIEQSSKKIDNQEEKVRYVVLANVKVNHNTCILSLQRLDGFRQTVPIGKHVNVFGNWNGEEISRSYTPIPSKFLPQNDSSSLGDVCLMIKKYAQGMLTPIICSSKKGDILELSNPLGSFEMRFIEHKEMFLMIAAGTGITPLLGLLNCVLERRNRKCMKATVLFFNRKEEDILLRDRLDDIAKRDSERFSVEYILSEPGKGWTGRVGRVTNDVLKSAVDAQCSDTHLFPADIYVTICGPTAFTKLTASLLNEMGYQAKHMHCFLG